MSKKRYTAEEIIHKLREADVLIAQHRTVADVCKQFGVTDQTYYRWRKEYGGMKVDQAKRLRDLETEKARLKRAQRLDPTDADIYLALAFTHSAKGKARLAQATAERGLSYCRDERQCNRLRAHIP